MALPDKQWATAYLGLGSNLGNCETNLNQALRELGRLPTIMVGKVSSFYCTAPVGKTDQPNFLNAAAQVTTSLSPEALLARILQLELQMGRVRTERWGPRVIDIDILAFGDRVVQMSGLTVPHPRLRERGFALAPLAEIAPNLVLPGDTQSVKILASKLGEIANILPVPIVSKF